MPEQARDYTIVLTDTDRIKVRQVRNGRRVVNFSVQYETLIRGHWRRVTRFDNAHGYAHRHVYYPHQPEYKQAMNTHDINTAFTEAQAIIKRRFPRLRESYILLLERGGEANHE
jgi:hypothetical protein